ncbi:ATP-binding protein [Fictibacillus sp. FJAT-27399]|uniref:ATP-binding protein n=1 Tax=Fictibacillus sp. FJAT-27399 TaxID=1729689 RepID=UPI0007829F02|nr:ATP-binding protein [Fictibacillus sp. FJAT-27399]
MKVKEKSKNLGTRFGGISPSVLRELSGVYQPFVKAIKEIISNSYDADAKNVYLNFADNFKHLSIEDDGHGMNPLEFIKEYIRIGKSSTKSDFTKLGRPRIGGKGIGFLAPARYCQSLEVVTKRSGRINSYFQIDSINQTVIQSSDYLLEHLGDLSVLKYLTIDKVTDEYDNTVETEINGLVVKIKQPLTRLKIWYNFDSSSVELKATINFDRLFSLDSAKSLEDIENFCEVSFKEVNANEKSMSYTKIRLTNIKDFVQNELQKRGKKGARNIESYSGIDQFLWSLSRIIPINSNVHKNIPSELSEFIKEEIDGVDKGYVLNVFYNLGDITFSAPLERQIIQPSEKLSMEFDKDIIKKIDLTEDLYEIKGFLIGQSSTIFPAESRGILIRVKGVAIGEPTFFDLDKKLTGSSKVALSQISGEINILKGTNAIEDINPGREGFYKESKIYNYLKEYLIGEEVDRLRGPLKDVIDSIILRSEINASINNFKKKYEGQRAAIREAAMIIGEMAINNPDIEARFFKEKKSYEMTLSPAIQYKAEGKLASYEVNVVEDIKDDYKIDNGNKRILLNKNADIWKRNINIRGINFEINYKKAKNSNLFCEVNSKAKKIYVNWEHPLRSSMGDNTYIKHCLATVASDLPQENLITYIKLVTKKV